MSPEQSPYFDATSRAHLEAKILGGFHTYQIPEYMREGILMYLLDGYPPGDFLRCVIDNDLKGACQAADSTNIRLLTAYVAFFYNCAPLLAWGTRNSMRAYCTLHAGARGNAVTAARGSGSPASATEDGITVEGIGHE
jgi:hypothetical protein